MSQEKILSKVLIPATGETYTIGVRGSREQVALKLTADSLISWSEHEVTIQNLSDGTEQIKQLSTDGECNFEIPLGNRYSIILPYIEGYTQPNALIYTASLSSRNIEHSYNNLHEYLTIRIAVRSEDSGHTAAMFNGREVTCKGSNGKDYTDTIQNGQVTILIPYGITYTIVMPQFDGLAHNHTNETFLAGVTARNLVYSYIDYNNLHITGLDKDGNVYTIAELQKMGVAKASQLIVAGAYNDATLAETERTEGGKGCGFCWDINNPTVSGSWAAANVDFGIGINVDEDNLPLANQIIRQAIANGDILEACGYYTNHDLAFARKDGARESALVIQIGQLLADAGLLVQADPTPLFRAASQRQCPIITTTNTGFILTYGQLFPLQSAQNEIDELYAAIGRSNETPKLTSGYWQSSLQHLATNAVILYRGTFYGNIKKDGWQALVGFDLP